jgi:hypothetical protein
VFVVRIILQIYIVRRRCLYSGPELEGSSPLGSLRDVLLALSMIKQDVRLMPRIQ